MDTRAETSNDHSPQGTAGLGGRGERLLGDARQRAVAFVVLLVPVLGALVASFLVTPAALETGLLSFLPPCAFKKIFGIPCASCGMTRAFSALSHGQFALAWSYNKLSPLVYAGFWCVLVYGIRGLVIACRDWRRLAST